MEQLAPPTAAPTDESHVDSVASTMFGWSIAICLGVVLTYVALYVLLPSWVVLLAMAGFATLGAISWWSLLATRRGHGLAATRRYLAAANLLMGLVLLIASDALLLEAAMGLAVFLLVVALLETGAAAWRWVALSSAVYIGALALRPLGLVPQITYGVFETIFLYAVPPPLLILTAVLGQLMLRRVRGALGRSEASAAALRQALSEAEARSQALAAQRSELASTVGALQAATAERAALAATIQGLTTPILPVLRGVLVLPLIGAVDAARAAELTDALLAAVAQQLPQVVIVDVTGLSGADRPLLAQLIAMLQAVTLLGAQPVVVGIRPALAELLVQLDAPFEQWRTLADLAAAVQFALTLAAVRR